MDFVEVGRKAGKALVEKFSSREPVIVLEEETELYSTWELLLGLGLARITASKKGATVFELSVLGIRVAEWVGNEEPPEGLKRGLNLRVG